MAEQNETLQTKLILRLFQRFNSIYGKHWADLWKDAQLDEVVNDWAEYLDGVNPYTMKDAIDHCANHLKFPPTLPEFKMICKELHKPAVTKAIPRHYTEEELKRNQERVHEAVQTLQPKRDMMAWAKRILENPKVRPDIAIRFAKEALSVEVPA